MNLKYLAAIVLLFALGACHRDNDLPLQEERFQKNILINGYPTVQLDVYQKFDTSQHSASFVETDTLSFINQSSSDIEKLRYWVGMNTTGGYSGLQRVLDKSFALPAGSREVVSDVHFGAILPQSSLVVYVVKDSALYNGVYSGQAIFNNATDSTVTPTNYLANAWIDINQSLVVSINSPKYGSISGLFSDASHMSGQVYNAGSSALSGLTLDSAVSHSSTLDVYLTVLVSFDNYNKVHLQLTKN